MGIDRSIGASGERRVASRFRGLGSSTREREKERDGYKWFPTAAAFC